MTFAIAPASPQSEQGRPHRWRPTLLPLRLPDGLYDLRRLSARFPPKNGFHQAVVHSPIGLFIAGLLLDFLGLVRKSKGLLLAGWYNLVLAALSAVAGMATGVFAMSLMKLPYSGLIKTHLIFAVGSSLAMWLMVALRVHKHENMNIPARAVYYALATAGLLLISWAGHLGGVFVYGE